MLPSVSKLHVLYVLRKVRAKSRVSAGQFWETQKAVYVLQWHLPRWVTCGEAGPQHFLRNWCQGHCNMRYDVNEPCHEFCYQCCVKFRPWSLKHTSRCLLMSHVNCIITILQAAASCACDCVRQEVLLPHSFWRLCMMQTTMCCCHECLPMALHAKTTCYTSIQRRVAPQGTVQQMAQAKICNSSQDLVFGAFCTGWSDWR